MLKTRKTTSTTPTTSGATEVESGQRRKLPPGWRWVKFGEVVRDVNEAERDPLKAGLERFIGLEHLEPQNLRICDWGLIESSDVSFTKRFRKGQVLFGKRRAYQRKVAVADFDGICSSDILTFEPKGEELLPELLPYIVQSDSFFKHALGTSAGSLSPRTRWSQLKDYIFGLPPRDEQHQTAAMLHATDDAESHWQRAIESASLAAVVYVESVVAELEASSAKERLGSLLCEQRPLCYGIVQPGLFDKNGVPFVRVCDMEGGSIDVNALEKVSPSVHRQYVRSVLKAGDVLVSVVGTIGRVAVATKESEGFNIARAVARLAPGSRISSGYLAMILRSKPFQQRLVGESFETARKTLNLSALAELAIPLPNRNVQDRFVAVAESLGATICSLQVHRGRVAKLRSVLLNNLLGGGSCHVQRS